MLSGIIDTLMLSSEGDLAVGAVGTANTYLRMIIVMFSIASTGMLAVMTLYIGAGKENVSHRTRRIGQIFNAVLGSFFSLFLISFSDTFLKIMGITGQLLTSSRIYMQIVGGGCIFNALIPIFAGHLRAFGHTKQPFYAALIGNCVNIVLNAVFLFVLHMGVAGVAIATVISYVVNLGLLVIGSQKLMSSVIPDMSVPAKKLINQILQIGIPSACETIIYTLAATISVSVLNHLDPSGGAIAARSYALQVSSFTHCASSAFSQANAITAGWYMGAGNDADCNLSTRLASRYSVLISVVIGLALAIPSPLYMHLFTPDDHMVYMVRTLLFINILLDIGRAENMCFGGALKAIGDARFPMIMAVIFMMLFSAGGTWFMGTILHIAPAIATFIAMAMDECSRAVFMRLRQKSGAWKNKMLLRNT